jgi:hypothetical protein
MHAINFNALYWSEKSVLYILAHSNEPISLAGIYNSLLRHAYLNGFFEDYKQADRDDYRVDEKKRHALADWVEGQKKKHRCIQYAASDINKRWGFGIPRYEAMRQMLEDFVYLELIAVGDPLKNGRVRYYMPVEAKEDFFLTKKRCSFRPVRKPGLSLARAGEIANGI